MAVTPATDQRIAELREWAQSETDQRLLAWEVLALIARIDQAEAERDALRTVLARVATSSCCGTAHGQAIAALDAWPEAQVTEEATDG